jgi:hypothetical protein
VQKQRSPPLFTAWDDPDRPALGARASEHGEEAMRQASAPNPTPRARKSFPRLPPPDGGGDERFSAFPVSPDPTATSRDPLPGRDGDSPGEPPTDLASGREANFRTLSCPNRPIRCYGRRIDLQLAYAPNRAGTARSRTTSRGLMRWRTKPVASRVAVSRSWQWGVRKRPLHRCQGS